jgi:hypothetical protein
LDPRAFLDRVRPQIYRSSLAIQGLTGNSILGVRVEPQAPSATSLCARLCVTSGPCVHMVVSPGQWQGEPQQGERHSNGNGCLGSSQLRSFPTGDFHASSVGLNIPICKVKAWIRPSLRIFPVQISKTMVPQG